MEVGKEKNEKAESKAHLFQIRSFWFFFVSSILIAVLIANSRLRNHDPDTYRNTVELIESRNFLAEVHHVETDDGFLLTLFRIVNPSLVKRPDLGRRPVLINHGLLASSDFFLINSPGGNYDPEVVENSDHHIKLGLKHGFHNNIGFTLANLGYDVWLANSRGNFYSRNHTFLDPEELAFWNFSTDEMIKYDQSAMIDYILRLTGKESLGYIGHSQGTLIMFGMLATQPQYSEKVKPFIAINPVATFARIKGLFGTMSSNFLPVTIANKMDGELLPRTKLVCLLSQLLCRYPIQDLCLRLAFSIVGFNQAQMEVARLPVYGCHVPAGTSWKNWRQYGQMARAKSWQMYDYGPETNLEKYGTEMPPKYPIEKIRSQYIALLSSPNDYITTPENLELLRKLLKERVPLLDDFQIPLDDWNHFDSFLGKDCGTLVLPKIVDLLRRFD